MARKIEEVIQQQKDFSSLHHKAMVGLMLAGLQLQQQSTEILRDFDVTVPQFNVMRILRGAHPAPLTMASIRGRMMDPQSDVSRIVSRLIQQQLATSCTSSVNKRACDVHITEKGLHFLSQIDPEVEKIRLADLTPTELEQIIGLVEKILK